MGTGASSKLSPTRRVTDSNTNYELRMTNFRAVFRLLVLLCALCAFAGNAFTQAVKNDEAARNLTIAINGAGEEVKFGSSTEMKRDALFRLRNFQSAEASRQAVPGLQDANEIVRATAAFAVIYLPMNEAFAALAPNLQDKSELVRRETAYALGKVQNPAAIAPLIQTFQRDKSAEVKNAAIVALGGIGDPGAVDFLTQILEQQRATEENDFLRRSAARSIGQIAQVIQIKKSLVVTPENFLPERHKYAAIEKYENLANDFAQFRAAVPVLTQILQNARESDDTRRETAFALGTIGDAAALPALQDAAASKDYYLAEIAKEALKKLSTVQSSN